MEVRINNNNMKKALLFTGITVLVSLNALAQEKNYRDKYFFITEEYEVGDTLEAKAFKDGLTI